MNTRCYICYYNENTDLSPLRCIVGEERLAALDAMHPGRARQSLLAEALLRIKLGEQLHIHPADIEITRGSDGKPMCAHGEISISHTEGAVAAAFSKYPIGVDVEKLRPRRQRAAKAYFTPNELNSMADSPDEKFWQLWTGKEAIAKAFSTGMTRDMKNIDTLLSPAAERLTTGKAGEFICSVFAEDPVAIVALTADELISLL